MKNFVSSIISKARAELAGLNTGEPLVANDEYERQKADQRQQAEAALQRDAYAAFLKGHRSPEAKLQALTVFGESIRLMGNRLVTGSQTRVSDTPQDWQAHEVEVSDYDLLWQASQGDALQHLVNEEGRQFLASVSPWGTKLTDFNLKPSFILRTSVDGKPCVVAVWQLRTPLTAQAQPFTFDTGLREIAQAITCQGRAVQVLIPSYLPVAGLKQGGLVSDLIRGHGTYEAREMANALSLTAKLQAMSMNTVTPSSAQPAQRPAPAPVSEGEKVRGIVTAYFTPKHGPAMFDPKALYAALGQELAAAGYHDATGVAGEVVAALYAIDPDWAVGYTDFAKVIKYLGVGMAPVTVTSS